MTTRADVTTAMEAARQEWDQHRTTVLLMMDVFHVSRTELADRMGMKRPTLNNRLDGHKAFSPVELVGVAFALGLDPEVLDLPPAQALHRVADDYQDLLTNVRNRCYAISHLVGSSAA